MKAALLALILLTAQAASPEVELAAEPHHHLTFENKSVRVFNVEVPPHSETLMHWHRHDYVAVTLGAAEILNTVKDKPPVSVKLQDGQPTFAAAPFAHSVHDQTAEPFRNVTIEILDDEALRHSTPKWDEERGLDILPRGTRQVLFVKDAIRVSQYELQPGGIIPLHHHAGPHLLVAVSAFDLRSDPQTPALNSAPASAHFKSGDAKWIPGGYSHTVTNSGQTPAKFVTLEFP